MKAQAVEIFCVVCTKSIPDERLKKRAVTCSDEHSKEYTNRKRQLTNRKKCLHCLRPSTLEERRAFRRFRTTEKKRPDLIYPEKFQDFQKMPASEEYPDRSPAAFRKYWLEKIGAEEDEAA